jgi:hypothetical protein
MITEKKMSLSKLFESFPSINLSLKEIREIIPAEEVMSRKFVFIDSDLMFDIEEKFAYSLEKENQPENQKRQLPPPPEVHYVSSLGIHKIMEEMNNLCGMDEIGRSDLEVLGFDYGDGENCHIYEILDEEKFLKADKRFNFNYKNVVLTKTDKYDSKYEIPNP